MIYRPTDKILCLACDEGVTIAVCRFTLIPIPCQSGKNFGGKKVQRRTDQADLTRGRCYATMTSRFAESLKNRWIFQATTHDDRMGCGRVCRIQDNKTLYFSLIENVRSQIKV